MYYENKAKVDFSALCEEISNYWKQNKIFEKSLASSGREMVFYDGPPFPTGSPHHGTIFVSILKDSLARFFTMRGYNVPRKWGWDCHGLPIENKVEQKFGINKSEIGKSYSVKEFNSECRKYVSNCNDAWETYINKIGRWVDYHNSYKTLDTSFMESVLWVFKTCYNKGLIYKDYRVTPYCWRCGTSLSLSDTRESDSMRPRQDPELTIKFKAEDTFEGKEMYFLAWTTTPWTLPSNLFLAVGEVYDYVAIEQENEVWLMAEASLSRYAHELGENPLVLKHFKGNELVEKRYKPMFPYFAEYADQGCFQVLHADFVTLDDGVGIVHVAPAFGEDDYWLAKRHGYGVCNPVDEAGRFTGEVPEFAGRNVLEANPDIIKLLKSQGKVVRHSNCDHNYPHCWRCREPLIYRADDAWYFAVEKIKESLMKINLQINWIPEQLKEGRFGKWLEGARDWNLSRSRFWGTPLPVWECENPDCNNVTVLGSLLEIEKLSGQQLKDIHKEVLDEVFFPCNRCGSQMGRVPEVLDCWFESASMPYAQCHYPFENKEWFENHFPADFIVEYPGQIRGWFYYLHVLSTALFERPAFRNCLVHGTLLAEDGTKLSKSKNNYTDPMKLIDRHGADALRLYLLNSSAAVINDLRFRDEGISEAVRKVMLPLWNAYSFFATYANIDGYRGDPNAVPHVKKEPDRWILASLHNMEKEVSRAFETYHLNRSLSPALEFLDNLTNWYIRRSRERFWKEGMTEDKQKAYDTLYYVLVSVTKILAPSIPFISEKICRNLTGMESVHLERWPEVPAEFNDPDLVRRMALLRKIAALGLALRQQKGIKVRQPLQRLFLALPDTVAKFRKSDLELLKSELNVKEIMFLCNVEDIATLRAVPDAGKLGPVYGKEIQEIICAARQGNVERNAEKNTVTVFSETKKWELKDTDIEIGYQGKKGINVISNAGILVGLDSVISPELREEGVVNDLNRCIQDLRKKAGYSVSDRILLDIKGSLADKHRKHLAVSALAELSLIDVNFADAYCDTVINDRKFRVIVKSK
jgi:isoleucyl-tRNA synthetase